MSESTRQTQPTMPFDVCVVGLGYVGLPLALTFAERGRHVLGYDIDGDKVAQLKAGESYLKHIGEARVAKAIGRDALEVTSEDVRFAEAEALVICVPTPIGRAREPDLSFIESTARSMAPHLRRGQLVVLESSTYPGTTREVLAPILELVSGLRVGEDFNLAYSPEREDPGNRQFMTADIPKLVGGMTDRCLERAVTLYAGVVPEVIPVRSPEVAELAKVYENSFRAVNIALVNELKLVCEAMDIDAVDVIEAARTKPFGFMPFYPGPGMGGRCTSIDPFYLTWRARQHGVSTRFIELAGEINSAMPKHVVERLARALSDRGLPVRGAQVLVLGVGYKRDIDDLRESPALEIVADLLDRGAMVSYHDPLIPVLPSTRRHQLSLVSVDLDDDTLKGADAVVIVTDHSAIDYQRVVELARLVVDTRQVTRGLGADNVIRA